MYKYIAGFIGLIAALIIFQHPTKANEKLYVVTTTAQIADIVRNVSGDNVRVEHLMGTGVDPHLYRPTRSDVSKLKKADIVFYNGLHLEGQMVRLFETLSEEKAVVSIADNTPQALLISGDQNQYDPHIWMNVNIWINGTDTVQRALSRIDQTNAEDYALRAQAYKDKLALLDAHIKNVIQTIPESARTLITAHDAFGYLGNAYGIEVIGIQGLSTESEAGLKRMEALVSTLVEGDIPAIFSESSVSARNINALIEGAEAQGHDVKLGGSLFSDAMGRTGTYEGTYIGMMEYNVRTLARALGGNPQPFAYEAIFASAAPASVQ